jgi:hypothetical protein
MGDLATYNLAYGDMLKEKLQTEARLRGRKVMTKATLKSHLIVPGDSRPVFS